LHGAFSREAGEAARMARPPASGRLRMAPSPASAGEGGARQKIDQGVDIGDTVFQEVLESDFAKNAISKFFRAEPIGIPRFAQIKIWKNLEAARN